MRMNRMRTFSVIITTRDHERYSYLINAESGEEAKRKAVAKIGFYGLKAPFREIVVYTDEQIWKAMGK